MKKLFILCAAIALTGCVTPPDNSTTTVKSLTGTNTVTKTSSAPRIEIHKFTVAGLDIAPSSSSSSLASVFNPHIRFGLVRDETFYIPANVNGTNTTAAPVTSHVKAGISIISQSATEDISTQNSTDASPAQ